MALATPIEIPTGLGFRSKQFQIGNYQQISPGGAGFVQTVQRSEPLWWAEYESAPLNDTRYAEAIAFLLALEGSMETFLAYDPRRVMPMAYASSQLTSNPWTQAGQTAPRVVATDFAASTLSLDRMATAAIITAGDYISFLIGKIWYLYRAQETKIVASSTVTVKVKPRPNLYTGANTLPADVRYRRACCAMKMIGNLDETDTLDSLPVFKFRAFQMLDRS